MVGWRLGSDRHYPFVESHNQAEVQLSLLPWAVRFDVCHFQLLMFARDASG